MTNSEIEAVLSVLWNTRAIRSYYEDRAQHEDCYEIWGSSEPPWGSSVLLAWLFSRVDSQKWKNIPLASNVRGRRISSAAMCRAHMAFEESYLEPISFALELVDRIRAAVAEAVQKNGTPEDGDDGDYEEEVGREVWKEIASDPSVVEKLAKLARLYG